MFFGNIDVTRPSLDKDFKENIREKAEGLDNDGDLDDWSSYRYVASSLAIDGDTYKWGSLLNAKEIERNDSYSDSFSNTSGAGFKSREHYRLGV